jgi:uncharacterized protein (DUF983 family)
MNEHSNNIFERGQIADAGSKIYTNLYLEDLPNEKWIDAFCYDGIYEVSNLGRIKSLQREANTKWGTPRIVEEKILKQGIKKAKNGRIDGLLVSLDKTKNSAKFIYQSFFPDLDFLKNECVMHINKNCLDNRIENLKKVTRKKSKQTDMVKSVRTIISTPDNLNKANERNKEFYDNRTHKECSKCSKIDIVENFPNGVSKCQVCINDYFVKRRENYEYSNENKECNKCGNIKLHTEFPKLDNTCKKCRYEIHKQYQIEQRETLGDWYVKEYGKYTYSYNEFTQKLIDELRNELKEKRKPRHIYDDKNFRTTRDFAKYVLEKYKVPITTTEKRIYEGRTEYECTLNRKQFVRYNLKKKR